MPAHIRLFALFWMWSLTACESESNEQEATDGQNPVPSDMRIVTDAQSNIMDSEGPVEDGSVGNGGAAGSAEGIDAGGAGGEGGATGSCQDAPDGTTIR